MSALDAGLLDYLSRQDDQLDRLIDLNERLIELQTGDTQEGTEDPYSEGTKRYLMGVDVDNLPMGWTGTALDDMAAGGSGEAEFEIAGSNVITSVNAVDNCSAEDTVEVVGSDNSVASVKGGSSGGVSIIGTGFKQDQTTLTVGGQVNPSEEDRFAMLDLSRRRTVDVAYDLKSGGPSIVMEVSNDQSEWWQYGAISTENQDNKDIIMMDTAFRYVRAYVKGGDDNNVNKLVISAKGI